jgi:hypothetical protein
MHDFNNQTIESISTFVFVTHNFIYNSMSLDKLNRSSKFK